MQECCRQVEAVAVSNSRKKSTLRGKQDVSILNKGDAETACTGGWVKSGLIAPDMQNWMPNAIEVVWECPEAPELIK